MPTATHTPARPRALPFPALVAAILLLAAPLLPGTPWSPASSARAAEEEEAATAAAGEEAEGRGPTAVAEGINAALIDAMRNADALGYEGRRERLEPVLTEAFNFPAMARVAVGQHWRELDEAQRQRLSETLARRTVADFAARFKGYSGERFEIRGERPMQRGSVLVENQLVRPSGEPVAINYVLREFDGGWRVIDIFLDAKFSELARTRAEYSSVLERSGFDALIQSLEDKIAQLEAEAGGA